MARLYAIANQKGGVGKSTTAVNLGCALAECAKRVLLIDFDPQAGLSTSLGIRPGSQTLGATIYEAVMGHTPMHGAVVETKFGRVHLVPSKLDLAGAEAELREREAEWQTTLKRTIAAVHNDYDYILVDCPPSLGVLTTNALVAANRVIVPVAAEFLAMVGLQQLRQIIEQVKASQNPHLEVGILRTLFDARTRHGAEAVEEIAKSFAGQVYETVIRRTVKFADAAYAGEPILTFASTSEAAASYRQLAKEVLHHDQQA